MRSALMQIAERRSKNDIQSFRQLLSVCGYVDEASSSASTHGAPDTGARPLRAGLAVARRGDSTPARF